jgi:hypothetical protein
MMAILVGRGMLSRELSISLSYEFIVWSDEIPKAGIFRIITYSLLERDQDKRTD